MTASTPGHGRPSTEYPHLLRAGRIGPLALTNRIVLPGMDMNHCDDGRVTAAEIEHYAARARGGCGLIITGAAAIAWPLGATSRHQPALSDDRFLPGLRALADAIHDAGSRLCVQLVHHGKVASVDTADGRPQLVPSIPPSRMDLSALADNPIDELTRLASATLGRSATFRVADADDIAWVTDRFAEAADRVCRAGADAVEIHGAHGYLLSTFLSRAYNQRTDDYGGSLENRSRLLVEVIRAVRATVGNGIAILVRLNGCEYGIEDGITADETAATARLAEAAGADAIHVSANAANPFADFTLGPLPAMVGQYREMAATVARAVSIPVIAVGRLLPEIAEEMLASGECDFVSMGRQQLADPDLVAKLVGGRRASIRPCINCYVCVEQNFFDSPPRCAVNTELGRSPNPTVTASPSESRHVVIVGAGPGGLETARLAAGAGHRVTVLERRATVGGETWFAAATGSPNHQLLDWLVHETHRPEIEIRTGVDADAELVATLAPDVVVVAIGRRLLEVVADPDGEPIDPAALLGTASTRRIAVIGGGLVGLSFADALCTSGHDVTVLEPGPHFGIGMAMPRRWTAVAAARANGVHLVRGAKIVENAPHSVRYTAAGADAEGCSEVVLDVDHVVIAEPSPTNGSAALVDDLRERGLVVHDLGVLAAAATGNHLEATIRAAHEALA